MNASAAAVMLAGGRWLVVLLGVGLGLAGAGLGFSDLSDSTFYGGGSVVGYWPYFLIALAGPVGAGATVFRRAWGAAVVAVASGGLLVARTAAIHVVVANVDLARADLTRFLAAHRGYISHLDLSGEPPASRVLTVTVKVPSAELEATLTALRGFGRVVNETQGSEDVTAQSVDLDARLSNARRTEQRLAAVLDGRQGRVADILEVEREIARVRGEIEQMEAERTRLTGRVDFAAVDLRIEEERRAGLAPSRPPFTRELANAAVDGYQAAVSVVTGFLLLVLRLAPTLLLFGILLLWPLRAAWRRATRLRVRQLPS